MATIIDTLLVVLGLDAKDFGKGSKQVAQDLDKTRQSADQTAKEMELSGKRAAEFFVELRNQALLAASVITGGLGLKEFVKTTVATERSVGNLSDVLNMNIEDLSAWENAAKYFGTTASGIDNAFESITKSVQGLMTQGMQDQLTQFLQQFHIPYEFTDDAGIRRMRDVRQIFLDISQFLSQHPESAISLKGYVGFDNDTLAAALKGRLELERLVETYGKLNVIMQKDRDAANELATSWNALTDVLARDAKTALTESTPFLSGLFDSARGDLEGKPNNPIDKAFVVAADAIAAIFGSKRAAHEYLMLTRGVDDGYREPGSSSPQIGLSNSSLSGNAANIAQMPGAPIGSRMRILQDELSSTTDPDQRSALMREIRFVQQTYGNAVLRTIGGSGRSAGGSMTTVSIANQTINAPARDADAIARSIAESLTTFVGQANSGIAR